MVKSNKYEVDYQNVTVVADSVGLCAFLEGLFHSALLCLSSVIYTPCETLITL